MTSQDTHTQPFNGPFSRTTRVSQYQKGKTDLDFTEARDSERIEHKLLSFTYKVLTTTQPSYLHNLITVQPPRSTRSSWLAAWRSG